MQRCGRFIAVMSQFYDRHNDVDCDYRELRQGGSLARQSMGMDERQVLLDMFPMSPMSRISLFLLP